MELTEVDNYTIGSIMFFDGFDGTVTIDLSFDERRAEIDIRDGSGLIILTVTEDF